MNRLMRTNQNGTVAEPRLGTAPGVMNNKNCSYTEQIVSRGWEGQTDSQRRTKGACEKELVSVLKKRKKLDKSTKENLRAAAG